MSLCFARFLDSAPNKVRTAFFWVVTQRVVVISCPRFGTGPETSVRIFHYSLRKNPEDRSSRVYSFVNLASRWRDWSKPGPSHSPPGERDPIPDVQEACLAPGMVWTCAENFSPTGIPSLDRPPRSERRYRLS